MTEFEKWWEQTQLTKSVYQQNCILVQRGYEYLHTDDLKEIFEDIQQFLAGESK